MLPPNNKKGSGYTNINRVVTANQGNRLGQTVASGVQNQANQVKEQTTQATNKFDEDAQKNRLDTQENTNARSNVIGRFNEQNYTPDESNFQVSSGLQNNYNTGRTNLVQRQTDQRASNDASRLAIQSRLDADTASRNTTQQRITDQNNYFKASPDKYIGGYSQDQYLTDQADLKRYDASRSSLENVLAAQQASATNQDAEIAKNLSDLESQYGEMSATEKASWIQNEKDKMMAANLPSEAEIAGFDKFRTGIYEGPKQLNDYQTLAGKAQNTEMLGDLSRSTGGRTELLKRFVGGAGYTQGQQGLDNLLLGQSGNALNQTRRSTQGLAQDVNSANTQATNLAQEYANRAKMFGEDTVNQLNDSRNPLSSRIDQQLTDAKANELTRTNNVSELQKNLLGQTDNSKGMDRIARLGLSLQDAKNSGYLTEAQQNALLGDQGLIQRSENLGLDTNALISERLQNMAAKNLTRQGVASSGQESFLNSIDRLLGKQGTDVEFGKVGDDYQKSNTTLDTDSLNDYLATTEASRQGSNTAEQLANYKQRYLDTSKQGIAQGVGGILSDTEQMFQTPTNLNSLGDQAGSVANATANQGVGAYKAGSGASNALMEGLTKLNIGGNSIANTEGGKQLLKAIEFKNKMENQAYDLTGRTANGITNGIDEFTKGNVGNVIGSLGGNAVGKALSTAFGGGNTGNWSSSDYNTKDATTGKKVKIGSYANKSSQDILKQITNQDQLNRSAARGKGGFEGSKAINTLLDYYNKALERESKKVKLK
jgi:hypothetical protein